MVIENGTDVRVGLGNAPWVIPLRIRNDQVEGYRIHSSSFRIVSDPGKPVFGQFAGSDQLDRDHPVSVIELPKGMPDFVFRSETPELFDSPYGYGRGREYGRHICSSIHIQCLS